MTEQPPPFLAGSPESSSSECWPNDPDYLGGRVWIAVASAGNERVGCYFSVALVDKVGTPLGRQVDIRDDFQVRFRVETEPAERWTDVRGTWVFDVAFSPPGESNGFSLASALPSGQYLQESYDGGKSRCVEVVAPVPPSLIPESGGTYELTATLGFQPAGGPITSVSGFAELKTYSFFRGPPPPGQTPPASPDAESDGPLLSATLQRIAHELSSGEITSFDVAKAIATRHPEYASGRLAHAALQAQSGAAAHGWALWRDSVAQLYDRRLLARSSHQVIDGRLFLIGLSLIDAALQQALDTAGSWAPLLLEMDEAVAPAGPVHTALQAVRFAYGYQGDVATGPDQLGVQGDVNAVCEVIVDPEVKPPLAVGLFGRWGTGKSFFMDKMRERVAELTTGASRRRDLNVVQIRFNAWHYADTSLWASLAVEVFERLADPEPVDATAREQWLRDHGDTRRREREELLVQLETHRTAKAALDSERGRLEAERRAVEVRRRAASTQRRRVLDISPLTNVTVELASDPAVRAAIGKISDVLGITPAVQELAPLGAELRTTAGYLTAVWRLDRHKFWTVVLTAASVMLTTAMAAFIVHGGWGWLGSLVAAASAAGSIVVTAAKFVRPAAQQVNTALAAVESATAIASRIEAKLRSQRDHEERILETRLGEIDREIEETSRAAAALDEKIAATKAAAEALTVGRGIYEFLADRAAGYQKHQGIVGMLHRDFRFLDAQLRAYRETADRVPGLPAIDRVVLYVDDLDRCPPAKVLEVLEAVHLLLALELFIVVVGVDPRWLQRSLRYQYRELAAGLESGDDPYLRMMPIEYLEKIFQIPFAMPEMAEDGYQKLIASLAPSVLTPPPGETVPSTPDPQRRPDEPPGGDRAPVRALLPVQPGSSASGAGEEPVNLTLAEVEFAQRLRPLVSSPRAAKRLMNTYRLIRATQHVGSRSRFLGRDGIPGNYQALLTLLAVAAGYPRVADRLLLALEDNPASKGISSWPDFVAALNPRGPTGPGPLVPADLAGQPSSAVTQAEAAEWASLYRALATTCQQNVLPDLTSYQAWGPLAARFSFTL